MLLNHEEIKDRKIIDNDSDNLYSQSSYNLRVGKIITSDGKEHESFDIEPQGLVTVVSEEILNIPDDVLGYAMVKNGLSQKGVLSINTGIVDSGWRGPIGSTVINFGRDIYPLKKGEIFLRMSFPKFNSPDISKAVKWEKSQHEYIKDTIKDSKAYLGKKFLAIDLTILHIRDSVLKELWTSINRIGALLGILAFIAIILTYLGYIQFNKGEIKTIEKRLDRIEENRTIETSSKLNKSENSNKTLLLEKDSLNSN